MKTIKEYFGQIRNPLLLLVGVFIFSMAVGYLTADPCIRFINNKIAEYSKDNKHSDSKLLLMSFVTPYHGEKRVNIYSPELVSRTMDLFLNNTKALAITLYGGTILFFIPIIQKSISGYSFGVVLSVDRWRDYFKRMTPHGFVELPLTFIVSSFAMRFGLGILMVPANEKKKMFFGNLRFATIIYLLSIPFSIIASVLEVYGRQLMWGL